MLNDEVDFNITEFKRGFKKKFDNFCKKAPIHMSYLLISDSIDVYSHNDVRQSKKIFSFPFDYRVDIKENIKRIKDILLRDFYPVLSQSKTTYSDYSIEELNKMVSEGKISLDDINTVKQESTETVMWRIERVIVIRDEVFIRNLTTNEVFRYKMKIPVTLFLKKCRVNLTETEAWDYFAAKSILKNKIIENYKRS